MNRRRLIIESAATFAGGLAAGCLGLSAQETSAVIHRLAELEIEPDKLAEYRAALREEIETSLRVEPGVLALDAVALKDQPTQIRIFERYASTAAYQSHIQSPHFKKYKLATQGMVKSLKLYEVESLAGGSTHG